MTGQPTRYAQHQLTCSLSGWQVVISDYQQMDRILKEERNYILQMIKKIRASGCNVLLIQKSILRDAVTDLSLHYLVSAVPPVMTGSALIWSCGKEHGHVQQMPACVLAVQSNFQPASGGTMMRSPQCPAPPGKGPAGNSAKDTPARHSGLQPRSQPKHPHCTGISLPHLVMAAPCCAWAIPEQQWHSLLGAGCTLPGCGLGEHM